MIAKQTTNPKEDFSSCVEKLFGSDNSPKVLWSIYYSMPDTNHCDLNINVPENVLICPGPDRDLDYDNSIQIVSQCVFLLNTFSTDNYKIITASK